MSTKGTDLVVTIDNIKEGSSDYRTTIKVMQAFISMLTWDVKTECRVPGSHFAIGRRMDTSLYNKIHPGNIVTPDVVVQLNHLGYVVEVKSTLARNHNDNWFDHVEQLQKYDDDLCGWWTDDESTGQSCVVLLVDITRSKDISDYFQKMIADGKVNFEKPLSIIEFSRPAGVKEFWFLRKQWGNIEDQKFSHLLEKGQSIPIENVVANPSYGEKKFYDAAPPFVEYTMGELWQHIFNPMKQDVSFDSKLKAWPIYVNVDDLTTELQRLYGSCGDKPREVEFPKTDWIRQALEGFVYLKYARKIDENNYLILFHLIKDELNVDFMKWREAAKKKEKQGDINQLSLFLVDPTDS